MGARSSINSLPVILAIPMVLAACDIGALGRHDGTGSGGSGDWSNTRIEEVYLAQTHVLTPSDPLFKLVGNRPALLKVQVVDPGEVSAPAVTAELRLRGNTATLTLAGPAVLPAAFDGALGRVEHGHEDSFTALVPAEWVQPGLSIVVTAANDTIALNDLRVGAPTVVKMKMFDVHYFGQGDADYPAGTFEELEAKWPVSDLQVERVRGLDFQELIVPARSGVGTPNVRVRSTDEYLQKTGLGFDGEQAAALQWVGALSAAGGNQDTAMCFVNIIGVPAGGQAGGFDGVGSPGVGILNHELGHALSLPHWGNNAQYPYKGDMYGIPAPDILNGTHVGPTWAFDLPSQTFIPPVVQATNNKGVAGTYKASPMQGGGTGDQEPQFLMRHFSDYGVHKMQLYLESKVAVPRDGGWFKWNDGEGSYSTEMTSGLGVRYPIEHDVQVVSVMAGMTLADRDVCMVYPPIGPYLGNRILTFDPSSSQDRQLARAGFSPAEGCDFTLRITQGGRTDDYMLPASGDPNDDNYDIRSLRTAAVNLRASDGAVSRVELLLTPDAEVNGLPFRPEVLASWSSGATAGARSFVASGIDPDGVEECTTPDDGPVKVFILAGQSNMVGHGTVYLTDDLLARNGGMGTLEYMADQGGSYRHLRDGDGDWSVRDDVWIADITRTGSLTVGWGKDANHIGPELQFGHEMGDYFDDQVLIIKTAWGGTSLAVDWRPPSSGGATGTCYDLMLDRVREVLSDLEFEFPDYRGQGWELVGFGWHQGWNDRVDQTYNDEYLDNLVDLINDLRAEFEIPDLPFVLATTGMSGWDESHPRALSLMAAQLAAPGDPRVLGGNVAAVETRGFYRSPAESPADQGYHWNRNAETHWLIGEGLARAMQPMLSVR